MSERIWTAALVVIGDEILSGRTHDRNIAQHLCTIRKRVDQSIDDQGRQKDQPHLTVCENRPQFGPHGVQDGRHAP